MLLPLPSGLLAVQPGRAPVIALAARLGRRVLRGRRLPPAWSYRPGTAPR
jgi:hypothetical protein